MASTAVIVGVSFLLLGSITAYSCVRIVEEGDPKALVVFGETKAVLYPGLNFVPPFVSKTYPVDPRTMTISGGNGQVDVPAEFEEAVREVTNPSRKAAGRVETDSDSAVTAPIHQRAATVFGRALFVLGAFGFAIPISMLSRVFGSGRWAVSWLFPEATLWHALLAAAASLFVMILGESVGRQYGTWGEE